MATVTSFTAARMLAIESGSVINGYVREADGHLILVKKDLTEIDAGPVAGTNVMGVTDSDSINFTIEGQGTSSDPWNISGEVIFPEPPPDSVEVTDWDAVTAPGNYWSTAAANSPAPGTNWFMGRVYTYPPTGRIIQEVRHSSSVGHWNLFTRYWNGGTWSQWTLTGIGRGTTVERDILFPTPTTDAERVALANRKVLWYNTDTGWEESYYATTGMAGLTVRGLDSAVAPGWYPTGEGPFITLEPTAAFLCSNGIYVGNWHNGVMRRKGGAAAFVPDSSGFVQCLIPGYYDIRVWSLLPGGTGTANFHLRVLNSALTTTKRQVDGLAFTLHSSLVSRMHGEDLSSPVYAGDKVALFCHTGSLNIHAHSVTPRGQLEIRYKGPMLVSD